MAPSVAVIGAGVNGVGAALAVQEAVPEVKVTIVAAELTPDTTGDGSAGFWSPRSIDGDPVQITSWGQRTHDFLHQLWLDGQCPGVGVLPGYDVADQLEVPYYSAVPFAYEVMSERALREAGHAGKQGHQYVTLYAEPTKMLPFLMERFLARGGRVLRAKVERLDQLAGYDVIVNCSGLGARDLVGDDKVMPVRGQVVKAAAPAVKAAKFDFPATYVIPNDDVVVLGGTAQRGDWRRQVDPADTERILAGCRRWIPSLGAALTQRVWAGLRPYRRGGVRLETERRAVAGRLVPVVHNYGHGGSGVTLFWGCALDVAELVRREVAGEARASSKL
ncbi:D-amino-acid oxidase-like [Pollicipes pollicipes]|uniref:D-amino-acid oxidase-like n=1 Tax=Pollicipes pollicipes TaxID=41117 RepID=UPI0018851448|nr:D-amino-acid oxidase-like [Pollicipes pollicipes]